LLKRVVLTKAAQELQEPDVPRQVAFTHAAKHSQIRLEQGKETLRPILIHLPATDRCALDHMKSVITLTSFSRGNWYAPHQTRRTQAKHSGKEDHEDAETLCGDGDRIAHVP
jgi:hypothetical protein